MSHRDFISYPDKFRLRWRDGETATVTRARMMTGDGSIPGVAVFCSDQPRLVLTAAHARALADMLHDELDRIEQEGES